MTDIDPPPPGEPLRGDLARDFLDWLAGRGKPYASGAALAEGAAALAERNLARAGGERLLGAVACRRGCAHCCSLPVLTTLPEAERALALARERLDTARFDALVARAVAAAGAYGASEPAPEPGSHPECAFLENDECVVHEARPLACRGWNSTDAGACRRARAGAGVGVGAGVGAIPVNARLRAVHANVAESLARALVQRGEAGPVYLAPALARLLGKG